MSLKHTKKASTYMEYAIAVSGMEQQEDHWLVVDTISQYLGVAVESVLPLFK